MKTQRQFRNVIPIVGALAVVLLFPASRASAQEGDAQAERLKAMRAKGTKASLTVFPVRMVGKPNEAVGDVLGLLLEQRAGMVNIESTAAAFQPPADLAFDELPAKFGEFVRTRAINTDYALYAEFVGTRRTRVREVRAVVVDKAGQPVWVDRQKAGDPDFERIGPSNPMSCCVLASERLRDALGLPRQSGKPTGEGKMQKRWAKKSALPAKPERDAIGPRLERMKSAGSSRTLTVFAVQVGEKVDSQGGSHLAKLLNDGKLCAAAPADAEPHFEIALSPNEQRRLWDLAKAFQSYVRANKPDSDYALFAEYEIRPSNKQVWAVHFVICDRAGDWVIVDFQNDHHADFKSVAPKTRDDCGRLIAKRLKGYLR